ncbi:hypothetical protein KBTX_04521 [wastewater metagenome]|uniref:Uncharacterized protein n=2 Tax=unclassified sequences TaxID=12908 RepID=A0A5B8RJ93_9ZZZZ|nr:hypothetical protein KBTEX_04521 [uncultured organism]
MQKFKFAVRQFNGFSAFSYLISIGVNRERAHNNIFCVMFIIIFIMMPAQISFDPGNNFTVAEWFGDIIVST